MNNRKWILGPLTMNSEGAPICSPTHESRYLWRLVEHLDAEREEGNVFNLTRTDGGIVIDLRPHIDSKVGSAFLIQQRTEDPPDWANIINLEDEDVKAQAKSTKNGRMVMMREVSA